MSDQVEIASGNVRSYPPEFVAALEELTTKHGYTEDHAEHVRKTWERLSLTNPSPPSIRRCEDGEVAFEWFSDRYWFHVMVHPDGRVSWEFLERPSPPGPVEIGGPQPFEALNRLWELATIVAAHLRREQSPSDL